MSIKFGAAALAFAAALIFSAGRAWAEPMTFVDATASAGIDHAHYQMGDTQRDERAWLSAGAAAEDFDGDGDLDLFVVTGGNGPARLYINDGNAQFGDQAELRGLADIDRQNGAAAGDFDGDGDFDLIVTIRQKAPKLYENDGAGFFTERNQAFPEGVYRAVTSPSWGDFDNDGDLDVMFGQWEVQPQNLWLYRNDGAGNFEEYDFRSEPHLERRVFSPRFADMDGDRLQDLLIVSDFGFSDFYRNLDGELFELRTDDSGCCTDQNGMGSTVGDIDNDGDLDWFVTSIYDLSGTVEGNWGISGNRMYRNDGKANFSDFSTLSGTRDGNWGWGASFGDLDLDGDLDLYHVNGWPDARPEVAAKFNDKDSRLYENDGTGVFTDRAKMYGADDNGQGRGLILADFDNDGDLDIYLCNNQELTVLDADNATREPAPGRLFLNETDTANGWLKVTLEGAAPFQRQGIGSRVHVATPDGVRQFRELHASTNFMAQEPGRIAHFGLGENPAADEVRAEWPNGDATLLENVSPNKSVALPSPSATVEKRQPQTGEAFLCDASACEPKDTPREWIVDGQALADPLSLSFEWPGPREVRVNIYEADGTTLHHAELLRLTVVAAPDFVPPPGAFVR